MPRYIHNPGIAMALLRRGKWAVTSAFRAHEELQSGQLAKASKSLSGVKRDGTALAKEAEELIVRIQVVETHYMRKEQAISRKVGELQDREQSLREREGEIKIQLEEKISELSGQMSSQERAERELAYAKKERGDAKKKKRKMIAASVATGVAGLAFSVATIGLGTPAAVAATAVCASVASDYAGEQQRAEKDILQSKQAIRETECAIESCKEQISQMKSEIYDIIQQIEEHEQEAKHYHEERGEIRRLIAFVKEAQAYWNEFADATKHGTKRAELVEKLNRKAQEKRFFGFFARRAGKRQAMSFLEAWEDVQRMVKGGSEHLFQMDFECSYCGCTFQSMPYSHRGNLVCSSCHY